jgi:hypothetical protein
MRGDKKIQARSAQNSGLLARIEKLITKDNFRSVYSMTGSMSEDVAVNRYAAICLNVASSSQLPFFLKD